MNVWECQGSSAVCPRGRMSVDWGLAAGHSSPFCPGISCTFLLALPEVRDALSSSPPSVSIPQFQPGPTKRHPNAALSL